MRLVLPSDPLPFDQPVPLRVEDCAPLDTITLKTRLRDVQGEPWEAWARFAAQSDGTVDPQRDTPLEASYFGFDPVGLLWSMAPRNPTVPFRVEPGPLEMEVEAHHPHEPTESGTVSRLVGQPGVARGEGELFGPQTSPEVVLLGPSREGAAMLAAHGHATLLLPLPEQRPLPLDWLLNQLEPLGRVSLVASGRAAEYALLVATRRPALKSLALCSGSGLAFDSSWSEVAGIPTRPARTQRERYANAVLDRQVRDRGRIEVERVEAPILFISGQQDGFWPASAFSELAVQRLRKLGQEFPAEHLTFAEAGHLLGPDGGVPHRPTGYLADLGGRPAHQAHAQRVAWQKLLEFLSAAG